MNALTSLKKRCLAAAAGGALLLLFGCGTVEGPDDGYVGVYGDYGYVGPWPDYGWAGGGYYRGGRVPYDRGGHPAGGRAHGPPSIPNRPRPSGGGAHVSSGHAGGGGGGGGGRPSGGGGGQRR